MLKGSTPRIRSSVVKPIVRPLISYKEAAKPECAPAISAVRNDNELLVHDPSIKQLEPIGDLIVRQAGAFRGVDCRRGR